MGELITRIGGLLGGLVIVTWLALTAAPLFDGDRGVPGPFLLLGGVGEAVGALVLVGLLVAVSLLVCRAINTAVGLFVLGCGLGVFAMRSGTLLDVVFSGAAPASAALETILWSVPVGAASWALFRFGGPFADVHSDRPGLASALEPRAIVACAAALAALPVAWVILRNPTKGQVLAAALLGGVVTGLLGRIWSPRTQPVLLAAAPVVAIGAAQFYLSTRVGSPLRALAAGDLPRLLWMTPIDVASGSLVGVALGLGWARSFIKDGSEVHDAVPVGASLRRDLGGSLR
ncbi:MAG TPA: hypothetical protein PKC43_09745 [Phycisphaerales bacterium]|nr:hypothetical protein [Phycisphaerales bacterium]HMP37717.1 hypothetical protein [Phycisphaerales bacterium]